MYEITMFIGPVIGGAFTDTVSWRWCFYINLPITAIVVGGIILCLENPNVLKTKKTFLQKLNELDYIGPLFFIPALVCLFLALQFGGAQFAWSSGTIVGLFFGFGILFPMWIYSQYRLGEKATIPFRVMFQRTVLFSSLFSFCTGAVFTILAFYIPFYFQAIQGSSATKSGVETLPLIITTTVASFVAGILVTVTGYYTPIMVFGMAESTIGGGLLTTLGVDTSIAQTLGYQILAAIGMGMNFQVLYFQMFKVTSDANHRSSSGCRISRHSGRYIFDTVLSTAWKCIVSSYCTNSVSQ
jgi:MFS family permease